MACWESFLKIWRYSGCCTIQWPWPPKFGFDTCGLRSIKCRSNATSFPWLSPTMANRLEPWERGRIPRCVTIYIVSLAAVFVLSRNAPPRSHSIWANHSHGSIFWDCFAPNDPFTCRPIIACMLTSLFEITRASVKLSKDSHFNS